MENIDDFMRKKFDSDIPEERFEFQEEFWEQAQVLLEQDEARRRRRLWLFLGFLLALCLLVWFLFAKWQNGFLSKHEDSGAELGFSTQKTDHQSSINEKQAPQNSTVIASDTMSHLMYGAAHHNEQSSQEIILSRTPNNKQFISSKNTSSLEKREKKFSPKGDQNEPGTEFSEPSSVSQANQHAAENPLASKTISDNSDNIDTTNIANTQTPVTKQLVKQSLKCIPTPLLPFAIPIRAIVSPKLLKVGERPIAEKTTPVRDQALSFGLYAAGTAYQQPDPTDNWAGWALGVYGDYRLNKQWSILLGAQMRIVPGHTAPADSTYPVEVELLRYSFGYKRETWHRETRGLFHAEVPISARWQKGPWGVEAGVAAGRLLGVHDRTTRSVESSLEQTSITTKRIVKGNAEPYNKTSFSGFIGADYQLNDRLTVMTRGQYRFTPVFKTLGDGVKNKGVGNVELGLRVRLF